MDHGSHLFKNIPINSNTNRIQKLIKHLRQYAIFKSVQVLRDARHKNQFNLFYEV